MISQPPHTISVVICAYTEKRWDDLVAAVKSVKAQTLQPAEIIVVIDHNKQLFERVRAEIEGVRVIENQEERGLSGARNSGIAVAVGDILAFMDEDAAAAPDWLAGLSAGYQDEQVMGVGGGIHPNWIEKRPRWFPQEFDWVVGCTYRGMPVTTATVRNMIGCNMSFRREVFAAVGGFRSGMGRIGTLPLGCEETELCIRAKQRWPNRRYVYNPGASVLHRVPAARGKFSYFWSRCYSEGLSKAAVSRFVGAADGLSSEQAYTFRVLPAGVLRGIGDFLRRADLGGLGRAAAIVAGLGITTVGYVAGRLGGRRRPVADPQPERRESPVSGPAEAARLPGRGFRVLVATPRYFPFSGGVENHVYQTAKRMAEQGIDVTVLTTNPGGKLPVSETIEGVAVRRVRAWPAKGDLYFAPGIYRVIRRGGWDLVHVQSYHTFVPPLAMLAALRSKTPYVVTFHGGGHSSRLRNSIRSLQRAFLRPLLARARRLVAVANFEIRQYGRELRIPRDRFVLIPNGCDLPKATSGDARSGNETLIVSVGRLERYKGHQRIIAALPHILARQPDARLRIAGAGPYAAKLQELSEKLGVAERVEIRAIPPSERQGMAELLSNSSLMVLLSDFETHPISALEALALDRPVLLADNSGMRELAERGWARAIPADSSPSEVAAAALQQIHDPILPQKMDWFSWDNCAQALLALYCEVLTDNIAKD